MEFLLRKFEDVHQQHVGCIADMAGSPSLCCNGADSESDFEETDEFESDELSEAQKEKYKREKLERAAEEIMDPVPEFLSYFVPKRMQPTDSRWRSILTSVRSFYRWCVAEQFIERNEVMNKSLLSLRNLPLDTLPNILNFLGLARYWEKPERGEDEAVNDAEGKLENFRKQFTRNSFAGYPFSPAFDREQDFERILERMDEWRCRKLLTRDGLRWTLLEGILLSA